MSEIVRTAFDAPQRAMGGDLVDWEGWYWPNHFGDPSAEHHAVRTDVGVWDASPLRKWLFRGPDALRAADRVFTNDMAGLDVGQVRYAPFCDENGKMVGDGTVFRVADDQCLVVTAFDSDLDHFKAVLDGMALEIDPMTQESPQLGINGPRSRELLQGLTDRVLGRARLRVLLLARGRGAALGGGCRGRCEAVRARRGRDDQGRVGSHLHRLRLLPVRDEPLR